LLDDAQCQTISSAATGDIQLNEFTIAPIIAQNEVVPTLFNIFGTVAPDDAAQNVFSAYGPVQIELRSASGTTIMTTMTGKGGNYLFSVLPSAYAVCIVVPGGFGLISNNECQNVDLSGNTDVSLGVFVLSTLPQITRNGGGVLSFTVETPYVDQGASAQKDGRDLTDLIVTTGLPDANVPGTYVTTYAVIDPMTHLGATTSRVVTVLPKVAPPTTSGTVLGGYAPGYAQANPVSPVSSSDTSASSSVVALSNTSTGTPSLTQEEIKKLLKAELRKKAMGAVLGAETVVTGTPAPQGAIVVSTTALSDTSVQTEMKWGYVKALLALVLFGGAIGGIWWWKKHTI
jgi:hypothetical protein